MLLVGLFIAASLGLLEAQRFGRRQAFIFEPEEIPQTEFIFIRLRFGTPYGLGAMGGWEHDYPQAEHHINTLVAEATGIDIERMSYQILNLDESPFDRRRRMASVTVDTAGAAMARHRIDIPYLDRDIAEAIVERLYVEARGTEYRW